MKIASLKQKIARYRRLVDEDEAEGNISTILDLNRETLKAMQMDLQALLTSSKEVVESVEENKPGNYELYSILIHSGSAHGGQYLV